MSAENIYIISSEGQHHNNGAALACGAAGNTWGRLPQADSGFYDHNGGYLQFVDIPVGADHSTFCVAHRFFGAS